MAELSDCGFFIDAKALISQAEGRYGLNIEMVMISFYIYWDNEAFATFLAIN